MTRPPRDPKSSLLSKELLVRIAYVSVLIAGATLMVFYMAQSWGWSVPESQSMAVMMLALGQAAYLFNARSLRESSLRAGMLTGNPAVWISIAVLIVPQIIFTYAPFMNSWFGTAPLDAVGWLVPLGLSVVIFFLVEVGKAFFPAAVSAVLSPSASAPAAWSCGTYRAPRRVARR